MSPTPQPPSTSEVRKRKWDEPAEGASKVVKTEGDVDVKPAVVADAAGKEGSPVKETKDAMDAAGECWGQVARCYVRRYRAGGDGLASSQAIFSSSR